MRGAYHHTPGLFVEIRLAKLLSRLALNNNALNISLPSRLHKCASLPCLIFAPDALF
jgi:hypothetical protein